MFISFYHSRWEDFSDCSSARPSPYQSKQNSMRNMNTHHSHSHSSSHLHKPAGEVRRPQPISEVQLMPTIMHATVSRVAVQRTVAPN